MANSSMSPLSLDSVTRVRQSGTVFSNPLANDLQKIMQAVNALQKEIAALVPTDSGGTPVAPTKLSDFLFPPEPQVRDNGALDLATLALSLSTGSSRAPGTPGVVQDTYANWTTANYPPAGGAVGTIFLITDWNVSYIIRTVTSVNTWVFDGGTYIAAVAGRPTTGFNGAALGVNDTGLEFYATDSRLLYYWDGTAWQILGAPSLASAQIWIGNASGIASSVTVSGDATLSNTGVLTLKTVNTVTPGSYGSATRAVVLTVNGKGQVTASSDTTISGTTPGGVAGGDLTGSYPNPTLALVGPGSGTYTVGLKLTGPGTNGTITLDANGRITAVQQAT